MHCCSRLYLFFSCLSLAFAQSRPANVSICDFYTTVLLKDNTAANQYTLLTLVVNTAIVGNYTKPNVGIAVDGILKPGKQNDTDINLLPYFDGGLESSNRGGKSGVAVNFLDDGGAAPLMDSKPANGTSSNQFKLVTHLYEFFGVLLGCSLQGTDEKAFAAYSGETSQYQVHKYMALTPPQIAYFITQVGASASSFGVAPDDIAIVAKALSELFDYKCAAPASIVPKSKPELQAICNVDACETAPANATCDKYEKVREPQVANISLADGEGQNGSTTTTASAGKASSTAKGSGSATGSGTEPTGTSGVGRVEGVGAGLLVGGLGLAAAML